MDQTNLLGGPSVGDSTLRHNRYFHRAQNQYPQAKVLYQRAVSILKKSLGNDHVDTAEAMSRLGQLYDLQGLYSQAEPLFQQAIAIREKRQGAENHHAADEIKNLAALYQ